MSRRHIVITTLIAVPICLILGAVLFLRSAYLLEKIRATLENRLGRHLEQPLLFTVADADAHAPTLNDGKLPETLRTAFADQDIDFSSAVSVIFDDELIEWIVSDRSHRWRYAIRREDNSINIFKYTVSIGDLSGDIFTGLSLKRFEVSDTSPQDSPLISAEEIMVKYDLWRLIGGRFHITKLRFMKPEFHLRTREDGRLNLNPLLTSLVPETDSTSDTKLPFQFGIAHIELNDGRVNYEDLGRNLRVSVSGIHSRVDGPIDRWEHSGRLAMRDGSIELNGAQTRIDEFETEFELLSDEGELKRLRVAMGNSLLTIAGKFRDLTGISRYLETRVDLDIDFRDFQNLLPNEFKVAGNARINLETKGTSSDINGSLRLELRSATFNNFNLEELNANAEFNRDALKLTDVNGTLASGKLTAGLKASFGRLGEELFSSIFGAEQSPRNTAAQTTPSEEGAELPIDYDGWVKLEGANVEEILPALIDLPDDFLTVTGVLDSHVRVNGSLPTDQQVSSRGKENLKAAIADSLNLAGDFKLEEAAMNDVPIRVSEASFQIVADQLQVVANLDDAIIRIDGAAGLKEPLDLNLKIAHIDAGNLTKILRVPKLSGDGALHGKITSEIPLTGFLKIPEASLFDVPIGVLTADFRYRDGSVTLQPVRLSKGESLLTLNGVAQIEGDIPVQFRVRAQPLQIADYVRLLAGADYPVEGVVTGNLILDGTLNALDGRGRLNVARAKAWDLALDPLTLPLAIEDYVVHVSDFEVLARNQRGVINFQISPELNYQLQFQSDPMRLKELSIARGIPDFLLDSALVVNATGEGNAINPRVDVNFDFFNVTYDERPIIPVRKNNRNSPDIRISGVFIENALRFEGTGFDGSSQIRGILESTIGNPYQLFMRSNGLNVSPILAIFHNSFEKMPATATGTLQLSGTLADLTRFTLDTRITNLALDVNGKPLTNAAPIKFGFAEDTWKVDSFSLASLTAKTADSPFVNCRLALNNEAIDFVAESQDFQLEPLCEALNLPANLTGRGSYKLVGAGTLSKPRFTLEWAIPELTIQNPVAPISISEGSGKIVYADHTLTVEPFNFLLMEIPVEAEATVAVDPADLQSSTLALQSSIVDFDLSSIKSAGLFRDIDYRQFPIGISPQGWLNLNAHLAGTFSNPSVNASIGVTDAKALVLDLPTPFENINFDLRITGGSGTSEQLLSISADTATWRIGEGRYQANARWRLPRTKTQSSLLDLLTSLAEDEFNEGKVGKSGSGEEYPSDSIARPIRSLDPSFQLQVDGTGINLTDFTGHSAKQSGSVSANPPSREADLPSLSSPLIGNRQISDYLINEKISQATVDARLELEGNGHSLRQIRAKLACDNLRADLNDRQMLNIAPIRAKLDDGAFQIDSLQVGSPINGGNNGRQANGVLDGGNLPNDRPSPIATWADIKGWIDLNGDLDFTLGLTDFPFGALLPGMTVPLFNSTVGVEASLTGVARVGGNVADPVIEAEWEARGSIGDQFTSHFLEFSDTGQVEYREQVFEIKQTRLSGYGNHLTIRGAIPIDLRLQPHDLKDRFLDRPVHLEIRSQEADLSFLSQFQPQLETVGGVADINFEIRGTTAAPHLYGTASLQNGTLKFANFDTPISNARINLRVEHGELRVPEFRFQIGGGSYALNVHCDMNGFFPRTVEVRSFRAQQAQINDFARNFLPTKIAANLTGYITAQANLIVPANRFVTAGETAWLPKTVSPLTLHNIASHAEGALRIQEFYLSALDHEIQNPHPIECHLADGRLGITDGFTLQDRRQAITDKERFILTVQNGEWRAESKRRDSNSPLTTGHYLIDMRLSNLNLAFVSDFLPDGYAVNGALNSELHVRGTGENPELACRWDTSDLSINRARVDECIGRIACRNGKLYTEEPTRLVIGPNRADFSASIPFDLSLDRLHASLPSSNRSGQADTIEGRLDVFIENLEFLPLIQPQVGFAEGSGSVNVTIGGGIDAPQLKGVANLAELGFNLPDANISVKKTHVTVDFTNEGFQIRRLDGVLNGGAYRAGGHGRSDWHRLEHLDLTAELQGGATFEDYGLYRVKCGEVNLTMKGAVGGGERADPAVVNAGDAVEVLPPIRGDVRIVEGAYERDWQQLVKEWFDREARIQFEAWSDYPIMRDLRFDLHVLAPNNFWVVSNLGKLNIEAAIDGQLSGRIQQPSFVGRVNLLPTSEFTLESIHYPFTIEAGSYVVNSNAVEFNPRYEIYAKTADPIERVQVISTDGRSHTRDVDISVHLSGYLREQDQRHRTQFYADVLHPGAGEEYDLTQAQIISILATGDVTALERSPVGASLPFLVRPSQRYFGNRLAQLIGVHEARLDLSPSGFEKPRFLLSREISERLLVTYSSTFQIHAEPRIEVEYQIQRGISVTGERSEQGKYGVDLKLERRF